MFDNDKEDLPNIKDCRSIIEKFLTVCLPVTTTPTVHVGKIKTDCCGEPIVSIKHPGNCCKETSDHGCCHFTIIQKMKVEIPVDFGAETHVDDIFVDCELKDNL